MKKTKYTVEERFNRMWMPEPYSGCWLWTGACMPWGYGVGSIRAKNIYAHRLSWLLHRGKIPNRMSVLHRCDTPACVNPDHLFLGTNADNRKDSVAKSRHAYGERCGQSKLTDEQIREIRGSSLSSYKLSRIYGVHDSGIRKIRRGDTWKPKVVFN
jgi:hypothetical protein